MTTNTLGLQLNLHFQSVLLSKNEGDALTLFPIYPQAAEAPCLYWPPSDP